MQLNGNRARPQSPSIVSGLRYSFTIILKIYNISDSIELRNTYIAFFSAFKIPAAALDRMYVPMIIIIIIMTALDANNAHGKKREIFPTFFCRQRMCGGREE